MRREEMRGKIQEIIVNNSETDEFVSMGTGELYNCENDLAAFIESEIEKAVEEERRLVIKELCRRESMILEILSLPTFTVNGWGGEEKHKARLKCVRDIRDYFKEDWKELEDSDA